MADSRAFEPLEIASHRGPYRVVFSNGAPFGELGAAADGTLLLDANVARLYADALAPVRARLPCVEIVATEDAKSLEQMAAYVTALSTCALKRGAPIVAIGGGVIQDIACFLAAIYMRGVDWIFHPTTLLAQADSCIGSKSSINVGGIKNLVGTFTPPREVIVNPTVLDTLTNEDVRSGIGEMLKVHAIKGPEAFDRLAADYDALLGDRAVLLRYVRDALAYKQELIEVDEFDRGPRLVMNYGHTFGHAIEAATDYGLAHGIGVTIGMDMANHVAVALGAGTAAHRDRMHPVLAANYAGARRPHIPEDRFFDAIARDKKNVGRQITLILPDASGRIRRGQYPNDERFRSACREFLSSLR
jgi:3-dehydroquinate synthase